jgi:hypothetical protein
MFPVVSRALYVSVLFILVMRLNAGYKEMDAAGFGIDESQLKMPTAVREEVANILSDQSRGVGGKGQDLRLKSYLIGLALFLDAECRSAIILNANYRVGSPALIKPSIAEDEASTRLVKIIDKLQTIGDVHHDRLAAYLLSVSAGLWPKNKEVVTRCEEWKRKHGKPCWEYALKGLSIHCSLFTE